MLPDVRASDADRDKAAAVLREAVAEGRLDLGELEERLTTVYQAKTYAELAVATRDLPRADGAGYTDTADSGVPRRRVIGFMGGFGRRGNWSVPAKMTALVFWGGGGLDLREARFESQETRIRAIAIMGGMGIKVPPDAEVRIRGRAIMGGFGHRADGPGEPGAPRLIITGFALWGGIGVRRRLARDRGLPGPSDRPANLSGRPVNRSVTAAKRQ
jgi:Domain of unknown function (DUF1707)